MEEDFQMQELLLPSSIGREDTTDMQGEDLERYIGIKHHFPDPYHIYLHAGDLGIDGGDPLPIIRFVIYSMGKKKVMMAGTYRRSSTRNEDMFRVSYACRYSTSELMTYISEWSSKFINSVNIMKNRINSRIDTFLGNPSIPYLRNRDDYIQLKAWLALQPLSIYYQPEKNPSLVRSIISTEYLRVLHSSFREFDVIKVLENDMFMLYLTGEDTFSIEDDIDRLLLSVIERLDKDLSTYESNLSLVSNHTKDVEILEISQRFIQWLQTSRYTSDTYVRSLQPCVCNNPTDVGCNILSWGDDDLYDLR